MYNKNWPELTYELWSDTCRTIQLWTQIIGKVRLKKTPWTNHSWNSTLYVSESGLTTSVIHDESFSFSIELDFIDHVLRIKRSDGRSVTQPLGSGAVSVFYGNCLSSLMNLGIEASIYPHPNELQEVTSFLDDHSHRPYQAEYAQRFHRVLLSCDRVFEVFRSRFVGKVSPVHFFWGSFDLAVTRFSGQRAPEHPGGIPNLPDLITREAYSHEVSSCGFWPGNEMFPHAAFYSYAYPAPVGFNKIGTVSGAFFDEKMQEFILPYEVVRLAENPEELLLNFFQTTYEGAAELGNWDRELLEESSYLTLLQNQERNGLHWKMSPRESGNQLPGYLNN